MQLGDAHPFLHIWDCEEGDASQLFGFAASEDGAHTIYVKATMMCLTQAGSQWGAQFFQFYCDDSREQRFRITDVDKVPPVITVPTNLAPVEATSSRGAGVSYVVNVTDTDGEDTLWCQPPSGSIFPPGETTVTCTASDGAYNQAWASFVVSVGELWVSDRTVWSEAV